MTFSTYGDMGDIIYLLPTMRLVAQQSGEPVTLYAKDGLRLHDPLTARIPLFKGLLEAQDYIEAVLPWAGEVDYDTTLWREIGYPYGVTLATLQAAWLRLNPDLRTPWLDVSAASNYEGKIIINRSPRYHNAFFPWAQLVEAFGSRMLFIGLESEHEAFCRECGKVTYLPTSNLLRAARVIAGSELFIGNQSSCYAIAEGLKHASIQETSLSTPDCIYPRSNATYCHDGALDFSFGGQRFQSKSRLLLRAHPNETPPKGWKVTIGEHSANSYAFALVVQEITAKLKRHGARVPKNLADLIIEQNSTGVQDHPVTQLVHPGIEHVPKTGPTAEPFHDSIPLH